MPDRDKRRNRCVYCGAPCRGSVCYAHRDLPLRDPFTRRVTTTATVDKHVEVVDERKGGAA